ncbi:hypothetical protein LTR32_006209 [Rachicladosporium monterosium]|uniref:Ribosomal RNA-processing protein 43 n=1 Tax=Rachicladosporium monterosium TaxID=1507873 RepID=A0ABR0L0Z6_9PEZI|nr:hypothetical protein LTR32_006209 [Rachicladosporium monterosium]
MANGTAKLAGLVFSRETFAKLTPGPFLQAHLQQPEPIRPNGRSLDAFRTPTIHTGSLSHSNGSAVVRLGDTAVVCGVRAEILLASDIPHPPSEDTSEDDLVERLGLLVPNALSYRVLSLMHTSNLIKPGDLRIQYTEPATEDDLPDDGPKIVTKAFWALYIDVLCIALDGNPFDAAWAAVIAALKSTRLPRAWWDPDREMILCSPLANETHGLRLDDIPVASTFAVFSTGSALKQRSEAESWVLADPDGFEEDVCSETVTAVVRSDGGGVESITRLEKSGGDAIDKAAMGRCVHMAQQRWREWQGVLHGG